MAESSFPGNQPNLKLDIGTIAGLVCAVVAILGGLVLENGSVADVAQGTAALIVFGGTLGAVLVSTPFRQVAGAVRALRLVFFEPQSNLTGTLELLTAFATKARREGLVALEEDANSISDPVFRRTLELAVDGLTTTELREVMELDSHAEESRLHSIAKVYETAGGYAPTIGILGAILGLIQVMKNLANIEEVGHGIAVAFVATIYGVGAANLIFLPAASKIRHHATRRSASIELIVEGVAGIVDGMNPRLLRRKLEPLVRGEPVNEPQADIRVQTAGENLTQ